MKLPAKCVAWLLPLLLTGCIHKNQQAQNQPLAPPIVDTPPPNPAPETTPLPPPVITIPTSPAKPAPTPPPQPAPKPKVKHKKQESKPPAPEEASNGTPGVSAIGQLSSGDPSDIRQQTEESIAATERGLKAIPRELSDQDQKTVDHIREFLKQAKLALASGDTDGASTLAAKAKVLLAELTK